ncbi:zinc finger, CCHC-type containing protein [Tanacetum coccineum]
MHVRCIDAFMNDVMLFRGWGGRSVKQKQHGSANVTVVLSVGDEPSTTAPIGVTAPIDYGNRNGMEEGNIGTCSTSIGTTAPNTDSVTINVTDSPTTDLNNTGPILSGPTSYAKLFTCEPSRKSMNFRTLITSAGNRADVAILLKSIRAISEHIANTAYGFFLGKRVAYPVVANCVRNTWSKYELVKSMVNLSNKLFFFQFSSKDCLEAMLESGSWFIRNNALILKK